MQMRTLVILIKLNNTKSGPIDPSSIISTQVARYGTIIDPYIRRLGSPNLIGAARYVCSVIAQLATSVKLGERGSSESPNNPPEYQEHAMPYGTGYDETA